MVHLIKFYIILIITSLGIITACNSSQNDSNIHEQNIKDSLTIVKQRNLQQAKQDSIVEAKADSLAKIRQYHKNNGITEKKAQKQVKKKNSTKTIGIEQNENFTIQVASWRSKRKAYRRLNYWKNHGYPNAYVMKSGNKNTGNLWFGVRLGNVKSEEKALKITDNLMRKYNKKALITSINDTSHTQKIAESIKSIEFDPTGDYAIQVEAWKTAKKAKDRIEIWEKRGFDNAYMVKFKDEVKNEVWFRVRLGRVNSENKAQKLAKILLQKYNEKSWITAVSNNSRQFKKSIGLKSEDINLISGIFNRVSGFKTPKLAQNLFNIFGKSASNYSIFINRK